jgi:hypothetical protein
MPVSVVSKPDMMSISLTDSKEFEAVRDSLNDFVVMISDARNLHTAIVQSLNPSEYAMSVRAKEVIEIRALSLKLEQIYSGHLVLPQITIDGSAFLVEGVRLGPEAFHPRTSTRQKSYSATWNGRCVMFVYTSTSFVVCIMPETE